jgi:3-oxoacyl-[acyl-carrier-protein] synthase-1
MGTAAQFLAHVLGTRGPCARDLDGLLLGAKALASAARLLNAGLADAVVAGGSDSLCEFTIAGFRSLESVSRRALQPASANRCGINIGEGARCSCSAARKARCACGLGRELGCAPHVGARPQRPRRRRGRAAVAAACRLARRRHRLHQPARHRDRAERCDGSQVVRELFGAELPVSSTKPLTGHTLGAAGAIEAAIGWLTLVDNPRGLLPPHWWDGEPDPALPTVRVVRPANAASGRGTCSATPSPSAAAMPRSCWAPE